MIMASYVIARMVQRYDKMEAADWSADLKYDMKFSNRPASGARVRLHEAENCADVLY